MKHSWLFSLLFLTFLNADELSYGASKINPSTSIPIQSLQIHSSKTLDGALYSLKSVPAYHRKHVTIHQIGDYYATRYQNKSYPKIPSWILRDFKKAGFTSSYTLYSDESSNAKQPLTPSRSEHKLTSPILTVPQQSLSQHEQTRLMIDAQNAYDKQDYSQATIYYEMMIASGIKDRQILLNLCYLYGREGSFPMMEKLIEGKRGLNDYLYAYGVGALEARRSDLYNVLSSHLAYDKSGRLAMLCGYFFEQEKNTQRAAAFYKMAYESAPNNPHILYAYARSVDISGQKDKALTLYTQLTQLSSEFEPLRFSAQSRIQTLRGVQ